MYTVLVGHPGLGKGAAINPAAHFIKESGAANIIGDRVTIEYMLEKLAKGFPVAQATQQGVQFLQEASCIVCAPELQIFATASQHTIPILTDLWDSREHPFDYGTKTQGKFLINKPTISLLGGSTPEWLSASIPQSAVGGGFTRRVNFVYAKSRAQSIPWPQLNGNRHLSDDLVEDLRTIGQVQGEITFDATARKLFEKFYHDCEPKEFDDEATAAYRTTAWAHATKLATAISIGTDDSRIITEAQLQTAITAVEEVRSTISLVFRAVGESDLVGAADRVMRYIELKGYASRQDIMRACWKHVGSSDVLDVILQTLTQSGIITEHMRGNKQMFEVVPQSIP